VVPDGDLIKPYALLREAMAERKEYAIAKVAMHNREHIVVLRPESNELMLHTLFFADEIAKAEVKISSTKFSPQELKLAFQLMETLTDKFHPEKFHDEYREAVKQLIEAKRKGQRIRPTKVERPAPVVNILE